MSAHPFTKPYRALHGAPADPFNHFATTSSVSFGFAQTSPAKPATPWMGEGQPRFDRMPSGFQKQFFRNAPPGPLEDATSHKAAFAWHGKDLDAKSVASVALEYTGDKNRVPLKACKQRGADKQPRYYPIAIGAKHNAEVLVAPTHDHRGQPIDPKDRFSKVNMFKALNAPGVGQELGAFVAITQKASMPPAISGFATASRDEAKKLINAPQTDGVVRIPALTTLEAERTEMDSTKRFFHRRDYEDQPFLSSSAYYQDDNEEQAVDLERRKGGTNVGGNTRPNTGFARVTFEAPFAGDVGESVFSVTQKVGAGGPGGDTWRTTPSKVVGDLLPTGFASNSSRFGTNPAGTNIMSPPLIGSAEGSEPPRAHLPERFAALRAKNDHLHWGGEGSRWDTTQKIDMVRPHLQVPLGGERKDPPEGWSVSMVERTGYSSQNVAIEPPFEVAWNSDGTLKKV